MTLTDSPFRPFKFAPFAALALFLFSHFPGAPAQRVEASGARPAPPPAAAAAPDPEAQDHVPAGIPSSGDPALDHTIFHEGERQGVDPRLIHEVIRQESNYRRGARSRAGARGLMQLMPATAERFGAEEVEDPASNVAAGTRYLRWLLKRFDGDVGLALAGYNAGEGSVDKYGGVPPYEETREYVRVITSRYGKTYHPVLDAGQARLEFHLKPEAEQALGAPDRG